MATGKWRVMKCYAILYLRCPIPFPFPLQANGAKHTSQAGPAWPDTETETESEKDCCKYLTTSASHIFRIVPHPGIESSPSVRAKRPTTCAAVVDFSFLTPTPSPSPSPPQPQSLSEPELQARQQRVCTAKSASGCHQILLNNTNVAPTTREVAANQ